MTHFSPNLLPKTVKRLLNRLSQLVLSENGQEAQYNKAKSLWAARKNTQKNSVAWRKIEQTLMESHPIPGICQYCEFDRTVATEHFFPVKHFPAKAFDWNNYLLVCHRCNSTYKNDQFAVFNPIGSSNVHHLPITRGTYPIPPTEDAVLINPRTERPKDYLMIDLSTGTLLPVPGVNARGKEKAIYSCTLLHLNSDANLLRYRKKAIGIYWQKLRDYTTVKNASNFADLINALPIDKRAIVVSSKPFAKEQARLLQLLKADLKDDLFPCVWEELKSQKSFFPDLENLFRQVPEVENW